MQTPPFPQAATKIVTNAEVTRREKTAMRTVKTPFQMGLHPRPFRSELQPSKISSRFHSDLGIKSSTRHYPSSSLPNPLRARLENLIKRDIKTNPDRELPTTAKKKPAEKTERNETLGNNFSKPSEVRQPHSIFYEVQVNDKTYKILRKIGSGGSAKVYEGFESKTSQSVAIKIINVAKADPKTQDSYFNEKSILKSLRDNNHVVKMFDYEYKAEIQELIIVMEKGDADLSQVIDSYFRHKGDTIDGLFIKFYWRGMLQAVNSIHKHGIVHADLKPVNFIIIKNVVKLIDFGIANTVDPGGTSIIRDYQIGTVNYMSPESLRNRALDASFQQSRHDMYDENNQHGKSTVIKYNSKTDIWSLGCILYNLIFGRPPFDNYKDIISKTQAIIDPRHVILFPEISNQNLLRCLKSCLRYRPDDRPSAEELLNDPYLRDDIITLRSK